MNTVDKLCIQHGLDEKQKQDLIICFNNQESFASCFSGDFKKKLKEYSERYLALEIEKGKSPIEIYTQMSNECKAYVQQMRYLRNLILPN